MKKLIIFDLDGTLLNTITDLGHAANFALKQMGFPEHTDETYRGYVGNGVRKLIERSLPPDARTKENEENMLRLFMAYYDVHCIDETEPYPIIGQLLKDLSDRGINLAVASNKYQDAVEKIINYYFPDCRWVAIEGQKPGIPTKPDPSIIFQILLKCPTPKADVLYVGDSGVDIETARRACVESVAVTWGFRPENELVKAHPDHIISDPDDLYDLLMEYPLDGSSTVVN